MAQVPERILSWLYSHLHEYHDPQRTYSDAVRILSTYPSLAKPSTNIYTYENGAFALLLNFTGTLPAAFRGTTYHFPIRIWIPHAYPHEAPMVYVTPGKDMVVKPGQHVGIDGKVYHPYSRDWTSMWDRANIAEFLEFLQQAFGKEPPVLSRAQQQQYQRQLEPPIPQQRPGAEQAPPKLPPKQRAESGAPSALSKDTSTPPPLPPKPGEEYVEPNRNVARDGPPLPPLPPEVFQNQARSASSGSQNGYWQAPRTPSHNLNAPAPGYQNGRPLAPPSLPQAPHPHQTPQNQQRITHERSPVSPISPVSGYSELPESKYAKPAPLPRPSFQQHLQSPPIPQAASHTQHQYLGHSGQPQLFQPFPYQYQHGTSQPPPRLKQPPPDLLSDPFEVALPGSVGQPLPAPPIPPNPEKEHLLQAISTTMVQQAQQKVNQNLSAIAPLQAQQIALGAAKERLEGEIRQLEQLDKVLSSNEAILHRSIQECDRTIATAKSKKQPPIDEVLIAPTMVANQLWTLYAEEAACREAMYVLQKAVDRGRVNGNDFIRQMRGLGRECFLKMALARKCARGMGLETR